MGKFERHIERKNESYENMNVDLNRSHLNVSYKSCGDQTYNERLEELVANGAVSLKGLKPDAKLFDELILDVNTEYFEENGGYEFACRFYEEVYRFCQELYGEENILSAVMHADEINVAATEKYGKPVYHYHLHVMALPVVEKEVRWTKRCKDPVLVGTVKEVIHQVSHSKKWRSEKLLDEDGNLVLNAKGKPIYRASYSVLQDKFHEHMKSAGFTGFDRGERGSTAQHLSVVEYKVEQEKERLADLTRQTEDRQLQVVSLDKQLDKIRRKQMDMASIEQIQPKSVVLSPGRVSLEKEEFETLSTAAKKYYALERKTSALQKALDAANKLIEELKAKIAALTAELNELKSVRGKLTVAGLQKENHELRSKVQRYEDIIDKHGLGKLFRRDRENALDDTR